MFGEKLKINRSLHRKGRYPSVVQKAYCVGIWPAHDIVRTFGELQDIVPQEIDEWRVATSSHLTKLALLKATADTTCNRKRRSVGRDF